MKFANITLGLDVEIDPSSSINNVKIMNGVKIAKRCSIYGSIEHQLEIGANCYIGMNTIVNGFAAKVIISNNVSISQNVNIGTDSGPNASPLLLKVFPIKSGPITIGANCWIGTSSIIMPDVTLGECCIVAANSFVNKSFQAFSIIGGNPARLIRSFTDSEKEKMLRNTGKGELLANRDYQDNYIKLPFENILREYRNKNILELLKKYSHSRFLEIGCGSNPMHECFMDFEKMVIVEPGKLFFEMAQANTKAKKTSNIVILNGLIEDVADNLIHETFDFIVIGGFLHEIDNTDIVLKAVRKLCSPKTIVYSFVSNARSFHRLLASKMGIIESIYQKSGHDILFNRQNVYDNDTFTTLFTRNEFRVIEQGSYFVKPFTHDQMDQLLNLGIIDKSCLDGLEKMIDFMPGMGAELWNICKIDD